MGLLKYGAIKNLVEPLVLCNNVIALIECVKGNRQLQNGHLKFSIDCS